ncbi:VTT domain-containing protein [Streptomyces sp. DSM 44915]|uniref:VTT domain-containing protein n=1 Tax=Streptomyces chisholmiae TaxID=3075540 RepID=A0ABU2JN56_9ACTN|nr:VTT domain-containing protein [Streptomyces sp. DSM 44915]MDT0266416.1 VTT domain-containing protein [Streptomyces sp. DSM 44915]
MSPAPAALAGYALAAEGTVTTETTQQAIGYPSLFALVLLGSLVPVVPTGALVSSAAVVAVHHSDPVLTSLLVWLVAAGAAFLGDAALYGLGARGSRWLGRISDQVAPATLAAAQRRLDERGTTVLLVSRLVPAGRLPVLLACLLAGLPARRYLRGNLVATVAWAGVYGLLGVVGGALFPHPWQGVLAAVALTLLIAAVPRLGRRLRRRGAPERP